MSSQGEPEQQAGEARTKRQARADRILDAALELLQRWGYKKTTIDDIAKLAGVAKGTVYLHWKTREALFEALVWREWLILMRDFRLHLNDDPARATLSGLSRNIVAISAHNPLLRAMLQQDNEMLGNLAHSEMGQETTQLRLEMMRTYLGLLREKNLLRSDFAVQTQIKMLVAIITGFFIANQYVPSAYQFAPDELAETVAETLHRTFEFAEPPDLQALVEVQQALNQLLDKLLLAVEHKYKEMDL